MKTNLDAVNKYRKTKKGFISASYQSMKLNAKFRGISPPNFTRIEYLSFLQYHPNFDLLFEQWINSGFDKWLRPSIDRINNKLGYTMDNIRLGTWRANYEARIPTFKETSRWKKSKFSHNDILTIRSRLYAGEKVKDLADEFKVARTTIYAIKNRENWRDL